VPLIAAAFAVYLLIFHRSIFRASVWGWLWTGALTIALFAPLGLYLANRPLEARLEIVGKPLLELRQGHPALALQTALGTLGMFTFSGDPEWLYNFSGRPVFDWLTGAFFYLGVLLAVWRWKRIEYGLLLIWLAGGISPALLSLPPGSFGHTIAALPAVYLLLGVGLDVVLVWLKNRSRQASILVVALALGLNAGLTVRDYVRWSQHSFVRIVYHADVADLARALRASPVQDIAVATMTEELELDARALRIDLSGANARPRLFDPRYALVAPAGQPALIALPTFPPPAPPIENILQSYTLMAREPTFRIYQGTLQPLVWGKCAPTSFGLLTLQDCEIASQAQPGQKTSVLTAWSVNGELPPTLKLFFHLVTPAGQLVAAGDRLDVWTPALRVGDMFIQMAEIILPGDLAVGDYALQAGVYDAATNQRLPTPTGDAVRLGTIVNDAP
jgi:hypothetical protein